MKLCKQAHDDRTIQSQGKPILLMVVLVLMLPLSAARFWRIITVTFSDSGATDFHSYWYYGHFVRQGKDPFAAYLEQDEPSLPVNYIDGSVTTSPPIARKGLAATPANTALLLLFLTPFAWLSWPLAKVAWMLINITIICLLPRLVIAVIPYGTKLQNRYKIPIYLASWCLLATSLAGGNGQTALLTYAFMLMAVLVAKKHWLVAGLALGMALSKYSLALPFFLFLLFKRHYGTVVAAIVVQLLGFVILASITQTPPPRLLGEYMAVAATHVNMPGIHLPGLLPANDIISYGTVTLITLLILAILYDRLRASKDWQMEGRTVDIQLLNVLTLWTLLAFYHREYDAVVYSLFVGMVIIGLVNDFWHVQQNSKFIVAAALSVTIALMSRPGSFAVSILPNSLSHIAASLNSGPIASIALTGSLFVSLWLFFRTRQSLDF